MCMQISTIRYFLRSTVDRKMSGWPSACRCSSVVLSFLTPFFAICPSTMSVSPSFDGIFLHLFRPVLFNLQSPLDTPQSCSCMHDWGACGGQDPARSSRAANVQMRCVPVRIAVLHHVVCWKHIAKITDLLRSSHCFKIRCCGIL